MFCLLVRSLLPSAAHCSSPACSCHRLFSPFCQGDALPSLVLKVAQSGQTAVTHATQRGLTAQAGAQIPGVVFRSHISHRMYLNPLYVATCLHRQGEASALPKSPAASFGHIHIPVHTVANIYTLMYTHAYIHAHINACTKCAHISYLQHSHSYMHIYSRMHTHTHTKIPHAYTHTHTRTHECTHTPIHLPPLPLQGLNPTVTETQSVQPA